MLYDGPPEETYWRQPVMMAMSFSGSWTKERLQLRRSGEMGLRTRRSGGPNTWFDHRGPKFTILRGLQMASTS
jgi:hypothetical protein